LGTKEKWKKLLPPPPFLELEKKIKASTHWLHVFLVSNTIGHHFWPRLMAGAKIEK
jgi:hypothetical protein